MKFSCCIEMIYTEYPFIERFYKAKEDGFSAVEFWNWDNKDIPAIKKALDETGLKLAAFQGNGAGRMVDERDFDIYLADVKKGIEIAKELGGQNIFLMSDIMQEDRTVAPLDIEVSDEQKRTAMVKMLKTVAPIVEEAGITVVIEPLNTSVDHAGCFLTNTAQAVSIVEEVGSDNIKLLFDAYHMQIMEGNIISNIKKYHKHFGHFHIADVPGRFQPGTGELNYKNILTALSETGYDRNVGFELEPYGIDSHECMKTMLSDYSNL